MEKRPILTGPLQNQGRLRTCHSWSGDISAPGGTQLHHGTGAEREKKEARKSGKHQCVVASHVTPTGGLACNPGLCPDWEPHWRLCFTAFPESTSLTEPAGWPPAASPRAHLSPSFLGPDWKDRSQRG